MDTRFDAAAFRGALLRLMPKGMIWSRDNSSIIGRLCLVWGATFARNSNRAVDLLSDAQPASTVEMLSEWEHTVGLPSQCSPLASTLQARRAQMVARLTCAGDASVLSLASQITALGYDVRIIEYAPARAGILKAGDAINGEAWAYAWSVFDPQAIATPFRAGLSQADDPLVAWPDSALLCELRLRNPAHLAFFLNW